MMHLLRNRRKKVLGMSNSAIEISSSIDVELVDHMGSDARIVGAARVSTQGAQATEEDSWGLINYLMRNRHGSPFEHGAMTFRISAPIFVFREWHRHRVGWSYNEESGRYTKLKPKFYSPLPARPLVQEGKPGHYKFVPGSKIQYNEMRARHRHAAMTAYGEYEAQLELGIAREVARMVLPVNIYSSMYATCNPRSMMHFLELRTQHLNAIRVSTPMHEINVAAFKMEEYFAQHWPLTYRAWQENGRMAP